VKNVINMEVKWCSKKHTFEYILGIIPTTSAPQFNNRFQVSSGEKKTTRMFQTFSFRIMNIIMLKR